MGSLVSCGRGTFFERKAGKAVKKVRFFREDACLKIIALYVINIVRTKRKSVEVSLMEWHDECHQSQT
jgi:hypothetical protein